MGIEKRPEQNREALKKQVKKIKNISDFLSDLKDFVSSKAQDIIDMGNKDCYDSMAGMSSFSAEEKLEKSLYKLFDIEI